MEDRFSQQLKKGVLEMLVLELLCRKPAYGYELLTLLKECSDGMFCLKEGTLYPILYRLEDEGLIASSWSQGDGRTTPKKIYVPTAEGIQENNRRKELWYRFSKTIQAFLQEAQTHEN